MELRIHENGGVCCSSTNSRGERTMPEHPCDKCKAHFASSGLRTLRTQEGPMDYTPPDPYAEPLKLLRAATAPASSSFAARYAAERAREFEAERSAALRRPDRPTLRALTANDVKQYVPPDPYAAGLARMRGEGR
jgi:hypothetical protein